MAASTVLPGFLSETLAKSHFRTVAGYLATDGEINPAELLTQFRQAGATILLPRTGPQQSLYFAPEGDLADTGLAGIPEPQSPAIELASGQPPVLMLVPSVALDRRGGRLGRGGGYYDRILPQARELGWTLCGLCYAADLQESLPLESHDISVDWCLTEQGLLIPGNGRT